MRAFRTITTVTFVVQSAVWINNLPGLTQHTSNIIRSVVQHRQDAVVLGTSTYFLYRINTAAPGQ
jgi:hypothetical protein